MRSGFQQTNKPELTRSVLSACKHGEPNCHRLLLTNSQGQFPRRSCIESSAVKSSRKNVIRGVFYRTEYTGDKDKDTGEERVVGSRVSSIVSRDNGIRNGEAEGSFRCAFRSRSLNWMALYGAEIEKQWTFAFSPSISLSLPIFISLSVSLIYFRTTMKHSSTPYTCRSHTAEWFFRPSKVDVFAVANETTSFRAAVETSFPPEETCFIISWTDFRNHLEPFKRWSISPPRASMRIFLVGAERR